MTAFVDIARIFLKAGDGGNGCLSFRREKYIPFGGPDGGSGGAGGDIYLQAEPNLTTLADVLYRPHYTAPRGDNGRGKNKYGRAGGDVTIFLPNGTIVRRDGALVADLSSPFQRILVCRGGRGGRGNASFKTSRQKAPRIAERGQPGEAAALDLELKVLADVGLVGYPNAGKSTLLALISHAHPKIADYPFTTLTPNLGVATHKGTSFAVADIPGLIEDAHAGRGLGTEFLRHIERTRVIVHVVDISGYDSRSAADTFRAINRELRAYRRQIDEKPVIVALNKIDCGPWEERHARFLKDTARSRGRGTVVVPISGATGAGIPALLDGIIELLSRPKSAPAPPARRTAAAYVFEPDFSVAQSAGVFHVSGRKVEDLVAMTDFGQPEAVARLQHIIKKMGIERLLRARGIRAGDRVRIGSFEFEFSPDNQ